MQSTSSSNSSDQLPQLQSKPATPQLSQQRGMSPSPISPASQQHWMPMQYPAAAMIMPPQMMPQHYLPPPPHYMAAAYPHPYMQPPPHPLHHGAAGHHNHRNNTGNNGDMSAGENKTIWLGDLHHWMDEQYLHSCFASSYEITNIKVIRNRKTGISEKYGFVEFNTHAMAEKALQTYAGAVMPNTDQHFRMNWASFNAVDKRADNGSDHSIFVGDLAADVTDNLLLETFANKYPSVKAAKVVIDVSTGRSKGYGFVRFGDDNERAQAMTEMNGVYCSTRPMRTGAATPRKSMGYQQGGYVANGGSVQSSQSDGDSTNTTIFVGGLDKDVTEEDLRQPFSQYGEIASVKIPANKNCGFVQFANRSNAEEALDSQLFFPPNKIHSCTFSRSKPPMETSPTQNPNPKSPIRRLSQISLLSPRQRRLQSADSGRSEAERVFRYFDVNGDGKISPAELQICLSALSAREAAAAVESLDSDGDGFLSLEDLERVMAAEEVPEVERAAELREAFSMYEMEGSGCITPKSLKRMLSRLGESKSVSDCKAMIRRYDLNGDGVLSFDEFAAMMR